MLNIETWEIEKLIPYINNPRKNDHAVESVASAIREFGFKVLIVAKSDGTIIDGHLRYKAAKRLNFKEVPVILADDLTEAQIKAFRISVNKMAELAEWDEEMLKIEIEELYQEGYDIDLLGFTDDELKDLDIDFDGEDLPELDETKADEVPEVEENPVIKRGDIIELGNHRLMCGDSTSEDDVKKLMDGAKIELVYTDPPYGINETGQRQGRGNEGKKNSKSIAKGGNYKDFQDDSIDYAVKALEIVGKLNINRQIWWGANYYAHYLPQSNNWIIWDKRTEDKYTNTNGDAEMAWVKSQWTSIRVFRHLWMGLVKGSEQGQARVHPTQKPVALAEWCFEYYKADFKNVMDLFGGSGATLIACENQNKHCYMMEYEPHYAQVIVQRWCDYTQIDKIKINGVEVNWEDYKEKNKR